MSLTRAAFAHHGTVHLQTDPEKRFDLFRSDQVDSKTGEVIVGNERWSLDQQGYCVIYAIDAEATRFRGSLGETYVLETP